MAAGPKKARSKRASRKQSLGESLALDPEAARYWRLQRGFTQQALAEQRVELDGQSQSISDAQVRRIEAEGRCGPTRARLLAAILDVEIAQLAPRDHRHLPCGIAREVSTDFVSRESEIESVLAALNSRGSVRVAASIEGLPGVGRTELALQICGARERERAFRIFWFDAEKPALSDAWADVAAPHLGIDAQRPEQRMVRIARPQIAARPGYAALLRELGGYTISVELAASFLRRFPDVDPAVYLAELEADRGEE